MIAERVEGERFVTVAPTPRLDACIHAAAAALRAAVPGADVRRAAPLALGPGTDLVPSLVVHGPEGTIDLVVEFRSESTGRYVLGPKRMAYSRHAVPELWFADPWRSRVAVLRLTTPGAYGWPPADHGPGAVLTLARVPAARVAVSALLAGWPPGRGCAPEPGEEWWETS